MRSAPPQSAIADEDPFLPRFLGADFIDSVAQYDFVVFSFRPTMETTNFRAHFTIWQSMTVRSMHSIRNSNRFGRAEPCTGVESNVKHNHINIGNKLNEIAKIVSPKPMAGVCVLVIAGDDFHICGVRRASNVHSQTQNNAYEINEDKL